MKGKRVVITGGAGFIGSNLAEELATDSNVIIIDDLSTGKRENLEPLLKKQNVKFIEGSILDLHLLQHLFNGTDYVFHQAAIPSVPRSIEDPLATNQANVTGTLKVLLAARDNNVRKVIYASSSSVYGDTLTLPKREDMVSNTQSPYAVSKLAGENYCQVFREVYGLPTVCLRYFNVYGPRQNPDSQYAAVIPAFVRKAREGNPPIIFGDGEQTRDFTFVGDAVQANIFAAQSNASGVFNIGRGKSITINQLAKLVVELVGSNVEPIHQESRPGDVRDSLADISKAKAFGYKPKYDIEEGLRETIRRFHLET